MARVAVAANSTWNIRNFRIGLIQALLSAGHEVVTISPDREGVKIGGTDLPHSTCEMVRSGMNPLHDLTYLFRLTRTLKREAPDVFLGFTIKPNIYGSIACRLLNISSLPNVSGLGTSFLSGSWLRWTVIALYRFAFRRADRVFFQNRDDEQLLEQLGIVNPGQSVVIPGSGINLDTFKPRPAVPTLRFLMIARLLGDKGVREYAEAAKEVRVTYPEVEFSLLGEFDFDNRTAISRSEVDSWVAEGTLEYLGGADDVRPLIAQASAVVLPSYREGLPRTLLEAAAMARPLIGTDVPGCREVIREGVTGLLCDVRSSRSLANALARFIELSTEDRARMGAAARRMVEKEYDERLVSQRYLKTIERLHPIRSERD